MARRGRKEQLVLGRVAYSFNHESEAHGCGGRQGDEPMCPVDRSADVDGHYVGQVVRSYAAAPGVGYREYEVTRVDAGGVWGVKVADTVRILTAREVR